MREGAEKPSVPTPGCAACGGARRLDWESFVGVKLFSWIAGVFLTIGAVLFLRYSIDHGWLSPPVQMAIGLLAGIGLLVACELKAARRYAVTANALDAAGLAILFATVFAGHARWNLVGVVPAFLLMAVIAALAVALALRRDSLFIAALGLLGGFATPALLSTGEDRPIELFSYLLLLNARARVGRAPEAVGASVRREPGLHDLLPVGLGRPLPRRARTWASRPGSSSSFRSSSPRALRS